LKPYLEAIFCRLKFEQRGKELNESKKGIEEMVQHLKTQLDERDVVIQELQRGLQAHQSPASLTELQEMKENVSYSPAIFRWQASSHLAGQKTFYFFMETECSLTFTSRLRRVLTAVHDIENYWVSGLRLSSGILNNSRQRFRDISSFINFVFSVI
jgi:hypothetical protein